MRRRDTSESPASPPEAPRSPRTSSLVAAIRAHADGAVLAVIVTPRAGRTALTGLEGDAVRIRVAAPPVDGAANNALLRFLAATVDVSRSAVRLEAGATSRRKRVVFAGVTVEELARRLGHAPAPATAGGGSPGRAE